jgi:dihydrofolate synthase/folylpolyglutamate synthase
MADTMSYEACLASIYKLQRFGIKLGLETIERWMAAIGDPQTHFKCIHIAGTNGKGSVAAMLSTLFVEAGIKVGRFTSPHLESFNERICIDNQPIGDEDVVRAYARVKAVEGLPRSPTFFEFATAMGFYEFSRQGVTWAIVETGMGGRLDATNIVSPQLSIITNLSLEHKSYLGPTLSAIAREKAGIIKPGVPVITGVDQNSALKVIIEKAAESNSPIYRRGHDFRTRRTGKGNRFNYFGLDRNFSDVALSLAGEFQIENAALVLAACELLERANLAHFKEETIRRALQKTQWSGRLEIVSQKPLIIVDGAHNLMAARKVGQYLLDNFKDRRVTLVVGILDDKPYRSILKDLTAACKRVIVTQPKIGRAIPYPRIEAVAREFVADVESRPDVGDAVRHAVATSAPDDVICIAGSLYVVGEAKTALKTMRLGSPVAEK